MKKELIQKIINFYENDGIVQYLLSTDDYQGYIEVSIIEDNNEIIYQTGTDYSRTMVYDNLKDCNFNDFRFFRRVSIL